MQYACSDAVFFESTVDVIAHSSFVSKLQLFKHENEAFNLKTFGCKIWACQGIGHKLYTCEAEKSCWEEFVLVSHLCQWQLLVAQLWHDVLDGAFLLCGVCISFLLIY